MNALVTWTEEIPKIHVSGGTSSDLQSWFQIGKKTVYETVNVHTATLSTVENLTCGTTQVKSGWFPVSNMRGLLSPSS